MQRYVLQPTTMMRSVARHRCRPQILTVCVVIAAAILQRIDCAHFPKRGHQPQSSFPVLVGATTRASTTATTRWRGGATVQQRDDDNDDDNDNEAAIHIDHDDDAYTRLAHAVQSRLTSIANKNNNKNNVNYDIPAIVQAFQSLSSSQQAFKGLDGAAHEAYQRTHGSGVAKNDNALLSVQGRARRSAARASAVANALGACELCELLLLPRQQNDHNHRMEEQWNQTLAGRQVLLNVTGVTQLIPNELSTNVSVLVLYEPMYQGGAGIHHGSIQDLATTTGTTATIHDNSASPPLSKRARNRGRLLIVVGDAVSEGGALDETLIRILEPTPKHVRLYPGPEVASVQARLYQAAGAILTTIEPFLRLHSPSCAIHFVGRSLSGGIAALAATILDGDIPMPVEKKKRHPKVQQPQPKQQQKKPKPSKTVKDSGAADESDNDGNNDIDIDSASNTTTVSGNSDFNATASIIHRVTAPLQGLGRGRTSALTLGSPPSLSANVPADFVTSVLYGDDVVCRITPDSWQRFLDRTQRALSSRSWGVFGSARTRMADTWTLAASNLQSHAVGSQGEEARLALTGRAYLIRPRRLGGLCSMHEVGATQLKGGREALRAAVLWQINDVVLSRSLWKHHQLELYIHGLDRVQLRGLEEHDSLKDDL